jgi:hypothetical protein
MLLRMAATLALFSGTLYARRKTAKSFLRPHTRIGSLENGCRVASICNNKLIDNILTHATLVFKGGSRQAPPSPATPFIAPNGIFIATNGRKIPLVTTRHRDQQDFCRDQQDFRCDQQDSGGAG